MPSVTSVGGTPGINEEGLVELLKAGMLNRQADKDRQLQMQYQQRALDQHDEELKQAKETNTILRQAQLWDTVHQNASKQADSARLAAMQAGLSFDEVQKAYNQQYKSSLANLLGSTNGKFSDEQLSTIEDTYGPIARQSLESMDVSGPKPNINPTGKTQSPSMYMPTPTNPLAALFGMGQNANPNPMVQKAQSLPALAQAVEQQRAPGDQTGLQPMDALKAVWHMLGPTYPYPSAAPLTPQGMQGLTAQQLDPRLLSVLQQWQGGAPGVSIASGRSTPEMIADWAAGNINVFGGTNNGGNSQGGNQ